MNRRANRLQELARLAGILPGFTDQGGTFHSTGLDAKRSLLEGLGFDLTSGSRMDDAIDDLRSIREGPLPRTIVLAAGVEATISLRSGGGGQSGSFCVVHEDGRESDGAIIEGRIELPALEMGYHRLKTSGGSGAASALVIAAPTRCWQPLELDDHARGWGLTAQVYGLRGEEPWCIGTYGDVAALASAAGRKGASFLGLSPVHALFAADPGKFSPYSPSSRLFLQTRLLDPRRFSGPAGQAIAAALDAPTVRESLAACANGTLVDYHATATFLDLIFEHAWDAVREFDDVAFREFRDRGSSGLQFHAAFEALSCHFRRQGLGWSGAWPEAYRDRRSPEVSRFCDEHADRIRFHAWLQFQADLQLGAAAHAAAASAMEIGLYRDLAVGADRAGSEVWSHPERYDLSLSIGAPPDLLGPQGQDWGLPPLDPIRLEADDFIAFRNLVGANMRHAGAIRIDHAFQLQRLFVSPAAQSALLGGYIAYPFEALLAVLRVESHRARCMVIAEDLGTAPRGFSDRIMASGLLSYRLLTFERNEASEFRSPQDYPREAIAAITTHDLPTLTGFWTGLDIDLRECFGVFDRETSKRQRAERVSDRERMLKALAREGLAPENGDEVPRNEVVRYLARTTSALVALQIEDVIGELQQANVPGLAEGPPNWRRRYCKTVGELSGPDAALGKVAALIAHEGRGLHPGGRLAADPPRSTYRLQLNSSFTFRDAEEVVPYLSRLGISHLYLSPILASEPGSTHGYDVVDHTRVNPELGGIDGFASLCKVVRSEGLSIVLDIVPNHMGIGSSSNDWWQSVLMHGVNSPHAAAFDITWERFTDHRLLLPVLAKPLIDVLTDGALTCTFDAVSGLFSLRYSDRDFPLRPASQAALLEMVEATREGSDLSNVTADFCSAERDPDLMAAATSGLARLCRHDPSLHCALEEVASRISRPLDTNGGTSGLSALLDTQHYRLGFWRLASTDINYRRFFDIATLAALRAEDPRVFEATHALIFRLVDEGHIQGLRIDHIDGLTDPAGYLDRLQRRVGPGFYILVEKILQPGESLPDWPVAGTTGYEALNDLDDVFVSSARQDFFDKIYRMQTTDDRSYDDQLYCAKRELLNESFGSEFNALVELAYSSVLSTDRHEDVSRFALREALAVLLAAFPVYRSYGGTNGPNSIEMSFIDLACDRARTRLDDWNWRALTLLRDLLGRVDVNTEASLRFRSKFQQLSGPLMARGLEDTLFYRVPRWIALNEVGGDPKHFGMSPVDFHASCQSRLLHWPHNLVATATHDTKHGEDARARLIALTHRPDVWESILACWNESLANVPAELLPHRRDSYLLLQSLVGHWPEHFDERSAFRRRWTEFAIKAVREAKLATSWTNINRSYEARCERLIDHVFASASFRREFESAMPVICAAGHRVSLARLVLKFTVPGVPDTYQGTECEDLAFVDPDNRRPVDFAARMSRLAGLAKVMHEPDSPDAKFALLHNLLSLRRVEPELFAFGTYEPLFVDLDAVIAFRRVWRQSMILVVVLRDPFVRPPHDLPLDLSAGLWRNLLTTETFSAEQVPSVGDLFKRWPAVLLRKMDRGDPRSPKAPHEGWHNSEEER